MFQSVENTVDMAINLKSEPKLPEPQNIEPLASGARLDRTESNERMMFWIAVLASQLFGLTTVIMMIVWTCYQLGGVAWSGGQQFNYHPLFLGIGLIYLYSSAILVYRVFPNEPKFYLKIAHAVLHLLAFIFTVIGLVAAFDYKKFIKKDDMYSMHSWIGMSTVILFGLQYVIGFAMFFLPWTPVSWRAKALLFHTFFGVGIFVMALASALTGTMEKLLWTGSYNSTNFTATGAVGNTYGLLLVPFGFLIVFLVAKEKYKRQPRPEEVHLKSGITTTVN